MLDDVMVRRLKDDLRQILGGFPLRIVKQIDIDTEVIKIIFRVTQNARDSDSDSIAVTLPRRPKAA